MAANLKTLEDFGVWAEYEQLIRIAVDASEEFDAFDPVNPPDDYAEMERLNQAAFHANVALVEYIQRHGQGLLDGWRGKKAA